MLPRSETTPACRGVYHRARSRDPLAHAATPLFNKKSALALLHPDTGTAAILRNELHAGFLQGPLNSLSNIVGHCGTLPVIPFETLDRRQGALRGVRQPRLGPAQQRGQLESVR